jgi:hypothetical protein
MLWFISAGLMLVLHDPVETGGDPHVCHCAKAETTDGWCAKCSVGYYAGQRVASEKLFKLLDRHGHHVSAETTRCAQCRAAMRSGAFCDDCHMGYVHGHGFFSRLCYHFAKGRLLTDVPPDAARKACCPANGDWCPTCHRGSVGNRLFDGERDFTDAGRYYEVFKSALQTLQRCENCAMAMIADSRCPDCRITYKDGKPVETAGKINSESKRK